VQYFTSIKIEEGETRAFYITLQSNGLRYTSGEYPVTNQHLMISPGAGMGTYPFGPIYSPRTWNGALHYTLNDNDGETVEIPNASGTLVTTYVGGNRSFGCQFDIVANKEIIITSLDIHIRSTEEILVEVYNLKGTHNGHETNSEDWGQPIFHKKVLGKGKSKRTPLPREYFAPIHLLNGEVQAFYITLKQPYLQYTNGISLGRVYATNDYLSILEGTGIGSYKFEKKISPRVFNGVVHYETISPKSPPILQIRTTMSGETGAFGNVFDVKVKRDLEIVSMSFHTDSTDIVSIEVWTRQGSFAGHNQSLSGWDRISTANVKGNGRGIATNIPKQFFTAVQMRAFSSQAFYITTIRFPSIRYSQGSRNENTIAENADLQIYTGIGVSGYPLDKAALYYPRLWNGYIHYKTTDLSYLH